MKVRIVLTVNVDPENWNAAFGTGTKPADVRADVQSYVVGLVDSCAAAREDGAIRLEQ